jgi:DNA polymerase-3 subunit alpha
LFLDQFGGEKDSSHTRAGILEMEEWPENQLLAFERELLGFYVSAHPLTKFERVLRTYAARTTANLHELRDQEEVSLGGIVGSFKAIVTKKGDRMAFVGLEDLDGRCEVIVFPELFKSSANLIQKDSAVFVRGRVNAREDTPKVIAEEIIPLEDVKEKMAKVISIDLLTAGIDLGTLKRLKELLSQHPGKTPVHISFRDASGRKTVLDSGEAFKVQSSTELLDSLEKLVGTDAVKFK